MRSRIRDVGNNLREFYPFWMRTAQVVGQGELGFVLAVPCVTVNLDKLIQSYFEHPK